MDAVENYNLLSGPLLASFWSNDDSLPTQEIGDCEKFCRVAYIYLISAQLCCNIINKLTRYSAPIFLHVRGRPRFWPGFFGFYLR